MNLHISGTYTHTHVRRISGIHMYATTNRVCSKTIPINIFFVRRRFIQIIMIVISIHRMATNTTTTKSPTQISKIWVVVAKRTNIGFCTIEITTETTNFFYTTNKCVCFLAVDRTSFSVHQNFPECQSLMQFCLRWNPWNAKWLIQFSFLRSFIFLRNTEKSQIRWIINII